MGTIIISHTSSIQGIRTARRAYSNLPWDPVGRTEQRRAIGASSPSDASVDLDELYGLGFWQDMPTEHLDTLIGDPSGRKQGRLITHHQISRPLPAGALLRVRPDVYCCSPEFAALLYSQGRPMPEVLALIMELLGTYCLPPESTLPISWGGTWPGLAGRDEVTQAHYGCEPATTLKRLQAMARWAKGSTFRGFRQAVAHASAGSASPAESIMYGMFSLPLSYGGFGFETLPGKMSLNHRIDFDESAVRMASGVSHAVCDAFIRAALTDMEYNGVGHEEANQRIHDGQRNNGLRGMGIKVVVINREQMRDLVALEAIAKSIYHDAGKRFRYRIDGYRTRQENLLNGLRRATGLPPV